MTTIKLKSGEARQLAKLLRRIARPMSEDDSRDMWRWVKFLEGTDDDEA